MKSYDSLTLLVESMPEVQQELGRYVRGHTRNESDAEELLQDTIVAAYQHIEELRSPDKLLPWMTVIARNRIRRFYGREARQRGLERVPDPVAQPRAAEAWMDEWDDMLTRILRVPMDMDQTCIIAAHVCLGWSAAEIARMWHKPPVTIYKQIQRWKTRARTAPPDTAGDLTAELLLSVKLRLMELLRRRAMLSPEGERCRNKNLAREIADMSRILLTRFPGNTGVIQSFTVASITAGRLAEFDNDMIPERWPGENRREMWDWRRIEEGLNQAGRLRLDVLPPETSVTLRHFQLFAAPKNNDAVPWEQLYRLAMEFGRLQPAGTEWKLWAAIYLSLWKTPGAGIVFLRDNFSAAAVTASPPYHGYSARLYYRAQQWKKAARHARAYLKSPCNNAIRYQMETLIRECRERE